MSMQTHVMSILSREADDHGRVKVEVDDLRRMVGLSRHDMIKSVWDLKAKGLVSFREDKSGSGQVRVTDLRLQKGGADVTSRSQKIQKAVMAMLPEDGSEATLTSQLVADASGTDSRLVSVIVAGMINDGLIQTIKDKGRTVSGWRITKNDVPLTNGHAVAEALVEEVAPPVEEPVSSRGLEVRMPETPLLDQYAAARAAATSLENNPYVAIEFRPDPLADEAVLLRNALKTCLRAAE